MRAGEVVPTLCAIRAHSRAFQPTSAVQAVAAPSFRIQLERALLSCSCFLLPGPGLCSAPGFLDTREC
jgi:hypothetical protein